MRFMIYGAYGYTGRLISQKAKEQGLNPILTGRNTEKTEAIAKELGFSYEAFSLENESALINALSTVDLVINCAGPFTHTFNLMAMACIKTRTHYLDITGEISVFEDANSLAIAAQKENVILCPGVGFDVVPTDCMAAKLKEKMPHAKFLRLGFQGLSSASAGTAKTTVEGIGEGGKIRRGGKIVTVPLGKITRRIDFGTGERSAMAIPWGDVSTAYHTTGIPNIEVYVPAGKKTLQSVKWVNTLKPILKLSLTQKVLKGLVSKSVKGPTAQERSAEKAYIWGEVEDDSGNKLTCRATTANGYDLTASASLEIAKAILERKNIEGGYFTPSKLVGADFVTTLPNSSGWTC